MKKEWVLTQDSFERLLDWLDADRERAGHRYEAIRARLIKIFTCRGCSAAEELADETINRVTAKVVDVAVNYDGDPALYFYGVAHKVHLEYLRKSQQTTVAPDFTHHAAPDVLADDFEPEYQCLEGCLGHLNADNRDLVLRYYQQDKKAKIEHRKMLANELGIAVNALRIRVHRIRLSLLWCVQECLEQSQPAN
jgi:DNA-directed RNA polymerase specialized sigma24 family protein